jgi:hypothetical protein
MGSEAVNEITKIIEQCKEEQKASAETHKDALDYLQSVYNDPTKPDSYKLRAASVAIEYERPRLSMTAQIDGRTFADALDRAIERSRARALNGMKLIEAKKV